METNTSVALISDIHGNLPALQAALEAIPDELDVICLGDIVGRCNYNDKCCRLVRDECEATVFGNHDARVRNDFHFNPTQPAVEREYVHVKSQLSDEMRQWINRLRDTVELQRGNGFVGGHARPVYLRDPGYPPHGFAQNDFGVPTSKFTKYGPYLDGRVGACGHTHDQSALQLDKFAGQSGLFINPGLVSNLGTGEAEYAIVDCETYEYQCKSAPYETARVTTPPR